MEAVLRIEVVTAAHALPALRERLEAAGVVGWTTVTGLKGQGERGARDAGDPSGSFENGCLLTTCPRGDLDRVIAAIRPILRDFGGECLVTEALRVRH